jgi:hypothetical protein
MRIARELGGEKGRREWGGRAGSVDPDPSRLV